MKQIPFAPFKFYEALAEDSVTAPMRLRGCILIGFVLFLWFVW